VGTRILQWLLILFGVLCLGFYGLVAFEAWIHQEELESELYHSELSQPHLPPPASAPKPRLQEGDLFGRLEVPRLNMSVMVMEGVAARTLRLGAGHIPGTTLGIAGHRDSFFRPLKDIQANDIIRFTSPTGTAEYRVVSTKIVGPEDAYVLKESGDVMTLVTCYPFYYIGPAPKRFIIKAQKT